MATEQTRLEFNLVETQDRLNYYKQRLGNDPNPVIHKWVEVYAQRLEEIKSRLGSKRN